MVYIVIPLLVLGVAVVTFGCKLLKRWFERGCYNLIQRCCSKDTRFRTWGNTHALRR